MTAQYFSTDSIDWQKQASDYLLQGNYSQAARLYEQAIEVEPDVKHHYWYLGLVLLLQEQEAEAQTAWLMAMMEGTEEEVELWTGELTQILQSEAHRQEELGNNSIAWLIREHVHEISPTDINNLLYLIEIAIELERFTGDELTDLEVIDLLKSETLLEVDYDLLLQVVNRVLDYLPWHSSSIEFTKASIYHVRKVPNYLDSFLPIAIKIAYVMGQPALAANIAELILEFKPDKLEILRHLALFYQNAYDYSKGIDTAKLCYDLSPTLAEKIFANYLIIRGLMGTGGLWQEVYLAIENQESMLLSFIQQKPLLPNTTTTLRLLSSTYFFPYCRDNLSTNRYLHNQVAKLCQSYLETNARDQVEQYNQRKLANQKIHCRTNLLKIGYLSHCLRTHSVGWLARGLFEHHDREKFEFYAYFLGYKQREDPLQEWYTSRVTKAHKFGMESQEVVDQIHQDEIDILIDLDSLTLDISCQVMALKPALIQATWLGWDASGIPAIDYFIADPYVLPDSAQDYYSEKIWRLPQTYIAVDGFEVNKPTLRRDELDIPSDAVVYLTAQRGYKRHPDNMRLQMKIIKEVPNSYFLIKGLADEESIKNFCTKMAEEEGVDISRLRFLPEVALESIHRANLAIADIILDTYPYNGATTTMETLWMGIPIVTRVGQQFAARNSYTMMMNVGVTEGIAWTDEEYVEWGIRLGKDEALRQQVVWKLRQSRHTSPLWNAKQFTREMENAYEQMWERYVDTSDGI